MKTPPNPRRLQNVNTNTEILLEESSITGPDLRTHLERLKDVSAAASKIFVLLGEQITLASSTIPVQRGRETVRSRASHPIVSLTVSFFF